MKLLLGLLLSLLAFISVSGTAYAPPRETYDAKAFTNWDKLIIKGSRKGTINVPCPTETDPDDFVRAIRLDLVGDSYTRGYAHGFHLANEIVEFTGPKLTKYFADEVLGLDLSGLPDQLQQILKVLQIAGAAVAPHVFKEAMSWVWEKEKDYVPQYLKDEMKGIAEGLCAKLSTPGLPCNTTRWEEKVQQLNMLPELIRMACTAYGAWGNATAAGNTLIQVRALDFGSGPFGNFTVVQTNRKIPGQEDNAFVSVTFPAFVGVITGVSQAGIGVSEKVWMKYGKLSLQPGHYDGEADVFVLRDILEKSRSKAEAEAYVQSVKRTFAIWIGIGDYETMSLDLVAYKEDSVVVLTDQTAPTYTGQPIISNIAYVDKHPQPSGEGPNGSLPSALQDFYGQISLETNKIITKHHQTGDLHIASYDFGGKEMYLALGRINWKGEYGPVGGDTNSWKAYNRPYLKFEMSDLWTGR